MIKPRRGEMFSPRHSAPTELNSVYRLSAINISLLRSLEHLLILISNSRSLNLSERASSFLLALLHPLAALPPVFTVVLLIIAG
jgi:hypothetical protein